MIKIKKKKKNKKTKKKKKQKNKKTKKKKKKKNQINLPKYSALELWSDGHCTIKRSRKGTKSLAESESE